MDGLPPELIHEIALRLPFAQFTEFIGTDRCIHDAIQYDSYFWHRRYMKDFSESNGKNWRDMYITRYTEPTWFKIKNGKITGLDAYNDNEYIEIFGGSTTGMSNKTLFENWLYSKMEFNGKVEFVQMSYGDDYIYYLDEDGELLVIGNEYGSITRLSVPTDIKAVQCGSQFAVALDGSGSVWGVGDNSAGQLGDGLPVYVTEFTKIQEIEFVVEDMVCVDKGVYYGDDSGRSFRMGETIDIGNNIWNISTSKNNVILSDLDDNVWISTDEGMELIFRGGGSAVACGENGGMFTDNDHNVWYTNDMRILSGIKGIALVYLSEDTQFVKGWSTP